MNECLTTALGFSFLPFPRKSHQCASAKVFRFWLFFPPFWPLAICSRFRSNQTICICRLCACSTAVAGTIDACAVAAPKTTPATAAAATTTMETAATTAAATAAQVAAYRTGAHLCRLRRSCSWSHQHDHDHMIAAQWFSAVG